MPAKKRVLIVDDHPMFREGLSSLVNRSNDYQVVGEASNGARALEMAEELSPHLLTLDISLPDMSGVEAGRTVSEKFPQVSILMLSMHQKLEYVAASFRAGAKGYLVKDATSDKLIEAMDTLCRGECYLDGNVSQEVVLKLAFDSGMEAEIQDQRYDQLSPREQQVMRMIAEGATTREMASSLSLSPKTVENHRGNLMKKLEVHNKMELVRYAARLGLIDIDQWKE